MTMCCQAIESRISMHVIYVYVIFKWFAVIDNGESIEDASLTGDHFSLAKFG